MHDIFRQSFGNEALFFCACFLARRCIKICKNQKYFPIYLHNSEKSCNFAAQNESCPCGKESFAVFSSRRGDMSFGGG